MYKLHDQIKAKKEQVKKLFEENNNCSFTPEINLNSKKILANNNKNIYERNEDYEIKKQENLDKLKAKQKKEIINTIPKINNNSKKIASKKNMDNNVYDRLYNNCNTNDLNANNLQNLEMQECTFVPKINSITDLIVNIEKNYYTDNTSKENTFDDFLERQKMFEEIKQKKLISQKNKIRFKFKRKSRTF